MLFYEKLHDVLKMIWEIVMGIILLRLESSQFLLSVIYEVVMVEYVTLLTFDKLNPYV